MSDCIGLVEVLSDSHPSGQSLGDIRKFTLHDHQTRIHLSPRE